MRAEQALTCVASRFTKLDGVLVGPKKKGYLFTLRKLSCWLPALFVLACAPVSTQDIAGNLSTTIVNHDDPATVQAGAPAYLMMLDGLIEASPEDTELLLAGARLYDAYASVFVTEAERSQRLAARARGYAHRALCLRVSHVCVVEGRSYEEFLSALAGTTDADVPVLFTYAATCAGWMQVAGKGCTDLAELPKIEAIMERIVVLDESYAHGRAHLYLGAIHSRLPPALGGRPEIGRTHFERAIELSDGRDLMAKVEFAKRYARLVFDRPLHDRLLQEVLDTDPVAPDLTLSNTLAQRRARALLSTSADYFLE